jgi:hypothetical protein
MTRPSLALCKKLPDGQITREGVKLSSQKYSAFAVGQIRAPSVRHPAPT